MTPASKLDLARTPIEEGTTLIEASAGTGKTYCLTGLVLRLLLERHVERVGHILVMTFTNAATAELIARIRSALRTAIRVFEGARGGADPFLVELARQHEEPGLGILRAALRELDDLEVCTIHGFCRRVLQQNALETGTAFDVEYVEDTASLLDRVTEDFWRRVLYPADPLIAAIGVHRRWTPKLFAKAYEDCRSHPHVTIEPEPLSAAAAVSAVAAAADGVRSAWRRSDVEKTLGSLTYTSAGAFTEAALATHLAGLEAFCTGGVQPAVSNVLETRSAVLLKRLDAAGKRNFVAFPFSDACDALEIAIRNMEHALRCEFRRRATALLNAEKRATGTAGFDDLLHRLYDALQDSSRAAGLRRTAGRHFRAVLVDEFQDTDSIQYEIFRTLFTDAFLFFIGDPKQAIYRFRGADVFAYMRAKRDAGRLYTLTENWRSESGLVNAITALFRRRDRPFRHSQIPFIEVEPAGKADSEPIHGDTRAPLQWIWIGHHTSKPSAARAACAATVDEITKLVSARSQTKIGGEPVRPRHVTVLVRTHHQAQQIQEALHQAAIPAVMSRAGNVFETDEASDLQAIVSAVLAPGDTRTVRGALATRTWGYDAPAIAALEQDEAQWEQLLEHLAELRETWTRHGFVAMAARLLESCEVRRRLLSFEAGERRLTNLLHLIELANASAVARHLSPEAVLSWLSRAIVHPGEHEGDATELRLESDAEAVQIVTIHKSKGLEYDIVFCPFTDAREPKTDPPLLVQQADGSAFYTCSEPVAEERLRSFRDEEQSEEARLLYVALTRAKHRCYVVWGQVGAMPETSALAALLHDGKAPSKKDAAAWRGELADFCRANQGLTDVYDHETIAAAAPKIDTSAATCELVKERALAPAARARMEPRRVASFSSFRGRGSSARTAEIPDHADPAEARAHALHPSRDMTGFARGAHAGTCLHEILERCDFGRVTDADTTTLVGEVLRKYRLDQSSAHDGVEDPASVVRGMLRDLTGSELPGTGFTLADVERAARLNEWQFYVPIAALSQRRLAACFARYGAGAVSSVYPAMLESLGERDVRGFLTGFVDLVFTRAERWYVIDWKSNHLGNAVSDYDEPALVRSMREHHYLLQYHLYVLALDRYLGHRLAGYDYERHFGGVYYAYLRAIRPGSPTGWYVDRPPRALIAALDKLMRSGVSE